VRASISVTLDDGTVMQGMVELHPQLKGKRPGPSALTNEVPPKSDGLATADFSLGARPFMKKQAANRSGHERLILLVAHFANGKVRTPVSRHDVIRQWGKMKPIMGGKYNGAYDTRARETGWLDSPKPGVFELCPGWEGLLK
jgi:hypothetical protein